MFARICAILALAAILVAVLCFAYVAQAESRDLSGAPEILPVVFAPACSGRLVAQRDVAKRVFPDRPVLTPWNCPDGKCPNGKCPPKEQVNVTVTVPPAPPAGPAVVPPSAEPGAKRPAFPWALCLGIVAATAALAGIVAFAFRVRSAETSET